MSGPFGSSQWMYNAGSDYEIDNSLRFDNGATEKLTFTPGSAGTSIQSITVSVWVKRGTLGSVQGIISAGGRFDTGVVFGSDDKIQVFTNYAENYRGITSSGVFRDSSAWYHIVAVWDTTNGTSTDRHRLYVNGVRQTVSAETAMPQNGGTQLMAATEHTIGTGGRYQQNTRLDGYLAEMHVLDGQLLLPTAFAESGDFGEWKPIDCKDDLTYGDNGFYLDFKSSAVGTASSTTIGADRSGNDNHYTSSNVAVTDQMIDTPTNNFCTVNPIDVQTLNKLKEGNLQLEPANDRARGTMGVTTGKWYFEVLLKDQSSGNVQIGISGVVHKISADDGNEFVRINHPSANGNGVILKLGGTNTDNLGAVANGNIIGVAFDMDAQEVSFLVNNSAIASDSTDVDFSGLSNNGTMTPHFVNQNGRRSVVNFGQDSSFAGNKTAGNNADGGGQGDFFYAPPSGYLALCTKNLTACAVTPSEHFNTVLYTGDGSAQDITTVGFQPDWVWIKNRSAADSHQVFDSVRGVTNAMHIDTTAQEAANDDTLTHFLSNGFTTGDDDVTNTNSESYVAWNWKAGTAFSNDASSTSVGSIDSAGSVNTDAGFSVIGYTGTGTTGTVAHGLAGVPEMYIVKNRDAADNWATYFEVLGNDKRVALDSTAIIQDTNNWDSTSPTSTVFTVKGGENRVNDSNEKYISYHFRSIDGYSRVGNYIGGGNVDTFVFTGFRPAFVLIKNTNEAGEGFVIMNNKSDPSNVVGTYLTAYGNTAEQGTALTTSTRSIDILSNGFKIIGNSTEINEDDTEHVFLALAETPFKYSNGR